MYAGMQACVYSCFFFFLSLLYVQSKTSPKRLSNVVSDSIIIWSHNGDMSNTQDPNKDRHLELLFHLQDSELRIATDILVLQSWTSAKDLYPTSHPNLSPWYPSRSSNTASWWWAWNAASTRLPDSMPTTPQSGLEEVAPSRISTCGRVGPIHGSWSDDPKGRGPPLIIGGCL